jgi:type VI secretion system secreted protein VgrG
VRPSYFFDQILLHFINMPAATELILSLLRSNAPRLLKLYFPRDDGPDAGLLMNRLVASETVSTDFEFVVTALSDDPDIDAEEVQGKMVCVELLRGDGSVRHFNGHCFEFVLTQVENGLAIYEMHLRPWLALFTLRRDHYIFHKQTITEQTQEIFRDTGLARHDFRLHFSDPVRTFSCQYGETDYNYLHRRWEQMGWHYFYEHSMKGHRLILSDATTAAEAVPGQSAIRFHHAGGANRDDTIFKWMPTRKLVAGKVVLAQFDFKKPVPQRLGKTSDLTQGEIWPIEVVHYEGLYGFADAKQGEALLQRRIEQIDAGGQLFKGRSHNRQLQPGYWFHLARDADFFASSVTNVDEADYFILSVKHTIDNNYLNGAGQGAQYENEFTCIKRNVPWRPEQGFNSKEVTVPGCDTATVVGRKGEDIYTDAFARVKLQFHWDRIGQFDENSSAWVRVGTPWAADHFGMVSIPRIGTEVIVQYLQGNPDRPIIVGQVYNQRNLPPWDLPANQTQSGILTRSSKHGTPDQANALRFEDKKGHEEIWMHAERDQRIEVEHNESHSVGHDRHKTIGHNETTQIKQNRMETVGVLYDLNVGAVMVTLVGVNQTTKVGNTISVTAGEKIELVCGQSKLVLTPQAIYLDAKDIHLKAGSKVHADGPDDVLLNSGTAQPAPGSEPAKPESGSDGNG